MTAKTVTFAVQIGSRGFDIARLVAEKLRFRYYDWEVTSRAAAEAGVSPQTVAASEQRSTGLKRILEKLSAASSFVRDDDTLEGPNTATMEAAIRTLTLDDYRVFIEGVVKNLGEEGNAVIVGHASQLVFKDEAGVLKVLICGSSKARAERLMQEEAMSKERALASVQSSDRERINFFKQVYKVDLLDASLYDITLNTDNLSPSAAGDLVVRTAESLST